jgi:hypothetical protein
MLTKTLGDYFFVILLVVCSGRNYPTRLDNGKQPIICCLGRANYHTRAGIATMEREPEKFERRVKNEKLTRVEVISCSRVSFLENLLE